MYPFFRRYLFQLEAEKAHHLTLTSLRLAGGFAPSRWILQALFAVPSRPVHVFGLDFRNPVGLAAGYDKDGMAIRGLAALGFGHIEIGTITPLPQPGNPQPRLFRLPEDEGLINRMGFPSRGSEFVQVRLHPALAGEWLERLFGISRRRKASDKPPRPSGKAILGINLGKNSSTPNEQAVFDYLELLQNFAPYADYLAINISSPNSVGLRSLQGRAALEGLLTQLHAQRRLEQEKLKRRLPVLVKLAPDLSDQELEEAVGVIQQTQMDGIILTNTTVTREGLRSAGRGEDGGLSGRPLAALSEAVLAKVVRRLNGALPVISVGGIQSGVDVRRRLDLGASLVQLYTALVYQGPGLVKTIVKSL